MVCPRLPRWQPEGSATNLNDTPCVIFLLSDPTLAALCVLGFVQLEPPFWWMGIRVADGPCSFIEHSQHICMYVCMSSMPLAEVARSARSLTRLPLRTGYRQEMKGVRLEV